MNRLYVASSFGGILRPHRAHLRLVTDPFRDRHPVFQLSPKDGGALCDAASFDHEARTKVGSRDLVQTVGHSLTAFAVIRFPFVSAGYLSDCLRFLTP